MHEDCKPDFYINKNTFIYTNGDRKPSGIIYSSDLYCLTTLNAFSSGISDLTKLDQRTNLVRKLTADMLKIKPEEMQEVDISDGYGETANIIAGNIKKELERQKPDTKLSSPKVVTGINYMTKIFNGEKVNEVKILGFV